jgi:hypothetical protein
VNSEAILDGYCTLQLVSKIRAQQSYGGLLFPPVIACIMIVSSVSLETHCTQYYSCSTPHVHTHQSLLPSQSTNQSLVLAKNAQHHLPHLDRDCNNRHLITRFLTLF